jgi:hypothetical protein
MIAHSVSILYGKDQPVLEIESKDTMKSALDSRICIQCSVASDVFSINQKRLVTVSHLLSHCPAAMAVASKEKHCYNQSPPAHGRVTEQGADWDL